MCTSMRSLLTTQFIIFKTRRQQQRLMGVKLNCKMVSNEILNICSKELKTMHHKPKLTIILSVDKNNEPRFDSKVYVNKKIDILKALNVEVDVKTVGPQTTQEEMFELIERLNTDNSNTGIMIQIPFCDDAKLNAFKLTEIITAYKDVDGLSSQSSYKLAMNDIYGLRPATPLGIAALLSYYGLRTEGRSVTILGKGKLVGSPLKDMLKSYPFFATVTNCDVFTKDLQFHTKNADIIVAACGQPNFLKGELVQEGSILIDCGINRPSQINPSATKHIVGDIAVSANAKSKLFTSVPGGVGLLTTSALAFNVMNAARLQRGQTPLVLYDEIRGQSNLNQFISMTDSQSLKDFISLSANKSLKQFISLSANKSLKQFISRPSTSSPSSAPIIKLKASMDRYLKILLLSSGYNGLTQNIEQSLRLTGHDVRFSVAQSDEIIRAAVATHQPDLIICPTLMKAIPKDIYERIVTLIIHPGIKGDRGPSSIDHAILKGLKTWGVTILQAAEEMDAGDIWATKEFDLNTETYTKTAVYNSLVGRAAVALVEQCVEKFLKFDQNKNDFTAEPLNYNDPTVVGRLQPTIRLADSARIVDWEQDGVDVITRKSRAADTQPGIRADLVIKDHARNIKTVRRMLYGVLAEPAVNVPSDVAVGEIFARQNESIFVRAKDGVISVKVMRSPKTKESPHPIKLPSTIQLADTLPNFLHVLTDPTTETASREIKIEFLGDGNDIGIVYFDFYNGAMCTSQCHRLASALCSLRENNKDCHKLKVLILAGSRDNWCNGIHLNVIENASNPSMESWENIKAINQIVKEVLYMDDIITVSAIRANAGAGGVYLGLSADYVFADESVVLNAHYKNMGLYGSELHTFTAPRRIGISALQHVKENPQPLVWLQARQLNLIDDVNQEIELLDQTTLTNVSNNEENGLLQPAVVRGTSFLDRVIHFGFKLILDDRWRVMLSRKKENFAFATRNKSVDDFEREELDEMRKDFFEDRNGFAAKRAAFVKKLSTA